MKKLFVLVAATMLAATAHGNELDNPTQPNPLQADSTIVVRVNTQTGAVEKLEMNQALDAQQAEVLAQDSSVQFEQIAANNIKSELDQEAGASSWFWYCPTYYTAPAYNYNYYNTGYNNNGYWYSGYYNYNYNNWNYYYYQPYYGNNYGYNRWGYGRRGWGY